MKRLLLREIGDRYTSGSVRRSRIQPIPAMKILITGATGVVGSRLVPALEGDHELRLLSRRDFPDDSRWRRADVTDIGQVCDAAEGMDVAIHLAIATGKEGDYEDDAFNSQRMDINVKGTYNLFEAARRHRLKRVIYTSSLTVVWGYPPPQWVNGDAPAKPIGTYALTKYMGEKIAEYYAEMHGISTLCLRIPKPFDIDDPKLANSSILPQWLAFPDLIQSYKLALTAPDIGFEIVTVVGESSKRRWDLSRAEKVLGYLPRYRLEDMGCALREEPATYNRPNIITPP